MKKITALLAAVFVAAALIGCGTDTQSEVSSSSTLYGQVEEITDSTITLLLGTMVVSEDESMAIDEDMAVDEDGGNAAEGQAPSGEGSQEPSGDMGDGDFGEEPSGEAPSGDSGEEPSGEAPSGEDGEAMSVPETAEGEAPSGDMEEGDFEGEAPSGDGGEEPSGEMESGEFEGEAPSDAEGSGSAVAGEFSAGEESATYEFAQDLAETIAALSVGDIVEFTLDDDGVISGILSVGGFGGAGGDFASGSSDTADQGSYANLIDTDGTYSGETYTSTGDDENALRIDGATATLEDITVDKSAGSSSDTENGDFYGVNAALLATNGAQVTITGATVTSSAQNGNGVFSYGSKTVVNISDSTITTTADNSGGIQTTGGGTTNATDLTVETSGSSSAAIRSDRGGGTVNVSGGTYTTNGYNSPAVYSTASISVSSAILTAVNSEALVVEGQNSITLEDCTVYGNMSDTEGTSSAINVHNIMIYQSTSGDAEEGTSYFTASGGSITSNNGDMFYITNTACVITLSDVEFVSNNSDGNFMMIAGNDASNGWGSAGSNGAQVELICTDQTIEGDITVDTISTLDITLSGSSSLKGTINIVDNEEGGNAVSDNVVVTIESGSVWTLTGNCTITSLTNNGTINYNGYTITLADGTVLSE